MDTLDGRYSRMSGKGTPFGAFLDSTLDRIEEGIVLTAVAGYFALQGDRVAAAAVVVAVLASLMVVLHPRARRGARRRVQGRHRHAPGARRDPLDRPDLRARRLARQLRAAAARGVRARGAQPGHRRPAHRARAPRAVRLPRVPSARRTYPDEHQQTATGPTPREQRRLQRRSATAPRATSGQGPRRDHRRRQLRLVRSCRASSTTATPTPSQDVPGLMHVDLGGYHVRDIEFTAAFDIDRDEGRQGPRPGDLGGAEQHDEVRQGAEKLGACRCTAA